MKKEKRFKNCYLIAPLSNENKQLVELLKRHEIHVNEDLYSTNSILSLSNKIEEGIRNADFVCAFLPSKASSNLFYEIGIARGLKKPIFLIIEDKNTLNMYLQDMVYVIASIKDINAIEFALDQFLNKYRQNKHFSIKDFNRKKLGFNYSNRELQRLDNEMELDNFLVNLFKNLNGVTVVKKDKYENKGIDMALWVDGLDAVIGNPILVELKKVLSNSSLLEAEQQLETYLEKTNSNLGLLIYVKDGANGFEQPLLKKSMVIWLEIHDLMDKLIEHSLAEIIITKRNEMVHLTNEGKNG